jgi:hypothetical protein
MIAPLNKFKCRYLCFTELSETTTIEPFALATDPNATTLEERCNFLVNDIENVFLVSDGNGGVTMILHSFKQLGNTLSNPTSKVVALQGLGSNVTPLIVDPRDLMSHETIFVPKIESIYDCDSVKALKALPAPTFEDPATTTTYHCSKCAIPGPIELKAILELDDTHEKYLIRQLFTQDPHICSKILYAAEIRCKLFWKDCLEAELVEDIDFSILEFDRIHHDLKLKNFHVTLPVCFIEVSPKTPTSPKRDKKTSQPTTCPKDK